MAVELGIPSAIVGGGISLATWFITWGLKEYWDSWKRRQESIKSNLDELFTRAMNASDKISEIRVQLLAFREHGPEPEKFRALAALQRLSVCLAFEALKLYSMVHMKEAPKVYEYALSITIMITNLIHNFKAPSGEKWVHHKELTTHQSQLLGECDAISKSVFLLVRKIEEQLKELN